MKARVSAFRGERERRSHGSGGSRTMACRITTSINSTGQYPGHSPNPLQQMLHLRTTTKVLLAMPPPVVPLVLPHLSLAPAALMVSHPPSGDCDQSLPYHELGTAATAIPTVSVFIPTTRRCTRQGGTGQTRRLVQVSGMAALSPLQADPPLAHRQLWNSRPLRSQLEPSRKPLLLLPLRLLSSYQIWSGIRSRQSSGT